MVRIPRHGLFKPVGRHVALRSGLPTSLYHGVRLLTLCQGSADVIAVNSADVIARIRLCKTPTTRLGEINRQLGSPDPR